MKTLNFRENLLWVPVVGSTTDTLSTVVCVCVNVHYCSIFAAGVWLRAVQEL